jgi:hypothetical protein
MIHMDQMKIVRDCHLWNDDLVNHIELMKIDLNKKKINIIFIIDDEQDIFFLKHLIREQYYFYA